jgi:hypothetical protein
MSISIKSSVKKFLSYYLLATSVHLLFLDYVYLFALEGPHLEINRLGSISISY